jgi:hypothetical protein
VLLHRGEVIEDQSAEPESELVARFQWTILGGMLFGRDCVPGSLHLLSVLLVAPPAGLGQKQSPSRTACA